MKRFRLLYITAITAILTLTACQNDTEEQSEKEAPVAEGYARVKLRISPAGSQSGSTVTRAGWRDGNARDEEMMYVWTVIIVNSDNEVVEIQSCKPSKAYTAGTDDDREIDDITNLPTGTYTIYSFANIGASSLETLLGLPSGTVPVPAGNDVIASKTKTNDNISASLYPNSNSVPPTGGTSMENVKVSLGANGKVLTDLSADNAFGLGSKGIPMSNVQTKTITSDVTIDLIVIRLFAKMELRLYNEAENDITVKSVTLSNVTKNPTTENNLMLLPTLTQHDSMDPTHGDIRPNLSSEAETGAFTFQPATPVTVPANTPSSSSTSYQTISFYVNESTTPTDPFNLFLLTLEIGNSTLSEYRYALISNTSSDEWSYIARNDYRIIPINLAEWQFRVEPLAFVPIGGYPAVVLSSDALTATFSTGGYIILQPFAKKISDSTWRDFSDPEISDVTISWKNSDGTDVSGSGKIVKTPFTYDNANHCITGELNNSLSAGTYKTTLTVNVKLGPTGSLYNYHFTCNIILQK